MSSAIKETAISDSSFSKPLQIESDLTKPRQDSEIKRIWSVPIADFFPTVINLFSATFGIGSLALSASVANLGIVGWLLTFALALFVTFVAINSLIYLAHNFTCVNFIDLTPMLESKIAKLVFFVLFFATNIGALLAAAFTYNDLICNIFKSLGVQNEILINSNSLFWLIVPMSLIFPLLVKRQFKTITFVTALSLFSAIYLTYFLIWTFVNAKTDIKFPTVATVNLLRFDWKVFPSTFGYLTFLLMSQPTVMIIYKEISEKSISSMQKMLTVHLLILTTIYSLIGLSGYLVFFRHPLIDKVPILELFGNDGGILLVIALSLMATVAINSFIFAFKPLKDAIIQLLPDNTNADPKNSNSDFNILNVSITFAIASLTVICTGFLIYYQIGFLTIIDLMANTALPVLFIMIPIYLFICKNRSVAAFIALGLSASFYSVKMYQYAIQIFEKRK